MNNGLPPKRPNRPIHGALVFTILDHGALVLLFAAADNTDLELGVGTLEPDRQRGDGATFGLGALRNFLDLLFAEQQLSVAERVVTHGRIVGVLGNIHSLHPRLVSHDGNIGSLQSHMARAHGFDLGTREHNAGHELLKDLVVEIRLFVLGQNLQHE